MLERTAHEAFQESQETGIGRIIRTFDPDVPGYVFGQSSSEWVGSSG
jgi:hypothetical protein